MSDQSQSDGQLSGPESLLLGMIIVGFFVICFFLLRWMVTTREGAIVGGIGLVGLLIYSIVVGPTPVHANDSRPALRHEQVVGTQRGHAIQRAESSWSLHDPMIPPPGAQGGCVTSGAMTMCEWSRQR